VNAAKRPACERRVLESVCFDADKQVSYVGSMFEVIDRCRICGNAKLVPVLNLGHQYLTGIFPKSREQKLTCGPLELVKCDGENVCGLVQLRHSYNLQEMYGTNYGYRSSLNRSMVNHLRATVENLLRMAPVGPGDLVLDIGSNDGTLLSFHPSNAMLVGIDPTSEKFKQYYQPHIHRIVDFFSAAIFRKHFPNKQAKIVTSMAMFYDLEAPLQFMLDVAEILAPDGIWHFEQSYLPLMISQNAYDTICHEHREYYALRQIKWMADRAGLKILRVALNDANGGSFAVTAARTDSAFPVDHVLIEQMMAKEHSDGFDSLPRYKKFLDAVFAHKSELLNVLQSTKAEGKTILGYGASTKGNVILQFCGINSEMLPAIAEVNDDKFGAFTPGSLIPIISEKEARALKPDYFVVMPWHFRQNLIEREAEFLKRGGKMIFPLPEIEIVGH
jgi:SAM-dependent methyltransferase